MASQDIKDSRYTIIVEHLDPELEDWQALEYKCIAKESNDDRWNFVLSGLSSAAETKRLLQLADSNLTENSVESLYSSQGERQQVCLLDPKAKQDLTPQDAEQFCVFLFGGILGDDPPRDRTGELRKLGFEGRRLGREQMTTDTAARVTRLIIEKKIQLAHIPYVDRPDINLPGVDSGGGMKASESVNMPFRYVRGGNGMPIMPEGMVELLARDAEKDILDLL